MKSLNIILDDQRADMLARSAERTRSRPDAVASQLLSWALVDPDPDPDEMLDLFDGIDGAHERARLGLSQARAGHTVGLDEL